MRRLKYYLILIVIAQEEQEVIRMEKQQTHYLSGKVCHSLEESPYDDMDESDNPYGSDEEY